MNILDQNFSLIDLNLNESNTNNNISSEEFSSLIENAKSFDMIDKSRLILEDKSLQEQFYMVSHFIQDKLFYYKDYSNEFNTKSSTSKLLIDPRHSFKVQCNGDTSTYSGFNKSDTKLLASDAIYDLKIIGQNIESVKLKISSEKEYNIPFKKNNDEWILPTFTKKIPLLLGGSSVWIKFYLVVTLKDNITNPSKIIYKSSHFFCKQPLKAKLASSDLNFKSVIYKYGYIYIKKKLDIITFLYSVYDIHHGTFSNLDDEQDKLNDLVDELNDLERYEPAYFSIFNFLEEQYDYLYGIFDWLVNNCDNLNRKNSDGDTILHVIAKSLGKTGKREKNTIASLLIECGCNENITNTKGQTAMEVAKENYPNFNQEKHWIS